ncbi:acyltransferase family protein [Brucella cytisi]|uniref:acyltransferase family protein n=1 Tax=Brucella cytisi TaxID=407152 RepID=UPI0035DA922D
MGGNVERAHFLDGLRGVAAVAVMLSHVEPLLVSSVTGNYAPAGITSYLFYVFTSGSLAVAIFFVISGYVLVASFAKNGGDVLAAGAVKRYFRLTPCIVTSMLLTYFVVNGIGYHALDAAAVMGGHGWLSLQAPGPLSFGQAISSGFLAPFQGSNPHNGVLWTMNIEFLGSIGLFGFASLFYRSRIYYLCVGGGSLLSIYMLGVYGIHFSLFLFGSLLFKYRNFETKSAWIFLIPTGLFLGVLRPWHGTMLALQSWLGYGEADSFQVQIALNSIGGVLIVFAVVTTKFFHGILSRRIFKYIGDISFSLYLVHLPIFFSIGCFLFVNFTWLGLHFAAFVGALSTVFVSLVVSHLMFKTSDKFSILLSNKIAAQFLMTYRHKSVTATDSSTIGGVAAVNASVQAIVAYKGGTSTAEQGLLTPRES